MNLNIKRFLALVIDVLLIGIPVWIIGILFTEIRWVISGIPVLRMLTFLFTSRSLFVYVYTFYETVMLYKMGGTLGKKIMKLKVVSRNPLNLFFCLVRGLLKALSLQIWMLGLCSAVFAIVEPHNSVHDVVVGTEVW